jgi:electron transfer flavoprotein beta subunit
MNIIVCVKQVAHIYVRNGYDPQTKGLVTDGLVYRVNPHDEAAVEEGIRLKEKSGGTVTVITFGPKTAEDALRWCIAMGADEAVHIIRKKADDLNPWRTASVLSDVIRQKAPDLVLFGKKAIDDELGQVGIFVAEYLGLPVVTAVTEIIAMDSEKAIVRRALERGNREEVASPLPVVLTVDKSLSRPRYPTFPARKAAQVKPLEKIAEPGPEPASDDMAINTIRLAPPKLKPKKILSPDSSMSAAARINFVMTGGMGKKKGDTVGGDPGKMASGIVDFLKEKQVIGS